MADLDTRIRELTYRLVEMAPEPPPFPVGSPAPRRSWRPVLVWAGATAVVIAAIALPVLFLLPTTDAPPPSDVAGPTTAATVPAPAASPNVVAFLSVDLADAEILALAREVEGWDGVTAVTVFTRDDALEEARALFADDPAILAILEDDPSVLPWSVRITAVDSAVTALVARLEAYPGVTTVVTGSPFAFPDEVIVTEAPPTTLATVGLTLSVDHGAPGDEVTVCGRYVGDAQVTLDFWHPATGYRWAGPVNSTIEVGDDGTWCWSGIVPPELLGLGPQGEEITVAVQPGVYEVRAASYPEDYGAQSLFVVEGVAELAVSIDQGWSFVSIEETFTITGLVAGSEAVEVEGGGGGTVLYVGEGRFEAVVDLTPGDNAIVVTATAGVDGQGPATASITVQYLPDAERRLAFIGEVRPGDFEITVDFAEWLTGEEANAAAEEDGYIASGEGVPNDYYIRNLDTDRTTLPIAENPPIILQTPDNGPRAKQVTYEHWFYTVLDDGVPYDAEPAEPPLIEEPDFGFFGAGSPGTPYWLTIHDGTVIQVEQQYVP